MDGVIPARYVPVSDDVYVKKDVFGWRVVHPLRDEHGRVVWVNVLVGGWRNFFTLLTILLLIGLFLLGHYELTKSMRDVVERPCEYCSACFVGSSPSGEVLPSVNVSELTILDGGMNE